MAMGQALFDLLNGKNLRMYPSDELRQQAMHTVAVESPRGWRIAKEKASKKIDGVVALSMACVSAISTKCVRLPGDLGISISILALTGVPLIMKMLGGAL